MAPGRPANKPAPDVGDRWLGLKCAVTVPHFEPATVESVVVVGAAAKRPSAGELRCLRGFDGMEQPVRSASVESVSAPSPRGRWWFMFAGLFLAIALRWVPVDLLAVHIDFGYFLPLLMGWMAHRYRRAAVAPLLVLAIPSFIRPDVSVAEYFSISLRFTAEQYLIGLVVVGAVAIPDIRQWLARYWRQPWRGSIWLVLAILVFESLLRPYWTLDFDDFGRARVDVGLLLVVIAVLASLRWRTVCERALQHVLSRTKPGCWIALVLIFLELALIMSVVNFYSPAFDVLRFRTGIAYAPAWSFALCFALTAFGIADARRVCLALFLIFMLSVLCAWYWPLIGELRAYPQDLSLLLVERGWQGMARFFSAYVVVDAVCAALLGAIFEPYLRSKAPDSLRAPFTAKRLGLIMAAQFVIGPFIADGSFYADYLVLAGVAFVAGALWRERALLAVPALILVCYFAASVAGNDGLRPGSVMSDLLSLGFVLFPFVLAGVLSHPHIALVASASSGDARLHRHEHGVRP